MSQPSKTNKTRAIAHGPAAISGIPSRLRMLLSPQAQQQLAVRRAVAKPRLTSKQWHLVIVPDEGDPRCVSLETVEAVTAQLTQLAAEPLPPQVFVFQGSRAYTTKSPHQYLHLPSGELIPLKVLPREVELATDGRLGEEPPTELPRSPRRKVSRLQEPELYEDEP